MLKVKDKKIIFFFVDRIHHYVLRGISTFFTVFYSKNKIATIIKHIPGHGLAKLDSHKYTPIVDEKKNILS